MLDDTDDLSRKMLCVVNVGDRGSLIDLGGGSFGNSTVKDGFDDFALLFDPPSDVPGDAEIWVYDGRRGLRYRDPNDPTRELRYVIDRVASLGAGDPAGLCAAGGKHLIGDPAYPDLAVGCPGLGSSSRGRVWILDMKDFSVDPATDEPGPGNLLFGNPDGGQNGGQFGNSIQILGDFSGSAESEILVGEPGRGSGQDTTGEVHYIDLTGNSGAPRVLGSAVSPAACYNLPNDSSGAFGAFTAGFGDVAFEQNGVPLWGEDRISDVVVGDPFWSANFVDSRFHGAAAWFNSARIAQGLDAQPMICVTGSLPQTYLGYYVCMAGDQDDNKGASGTTTASWDFLVPKGTRFAGLQSIDSYRMEINGIQAFPGFFGWSADSLFPIWKDMNPASQALVDHGHAYQLAAVGDIDLDAVYEGHDDHAYVKYNEQDVINFEYLRHEVEVADGGSSTIPPGVLHRITRDPIADRELLGTVTNTSWSGQSRPRRTTVSKLGDVDGDGLDDFGVVSGYSTSSSYSQGEPPTHSCMLIYGSTKFPPPGLQSMTPILRGNSVAQRGSRIMVYLKGLPANAPVTLWEDTGLMQPGVSEAGCQGTRSVGGSMIQQTANAQGEVFFVFDLEYEAADPDRRTPGTAWFYQARVGGYAGTFPCRMSTVRTLHIVDTSNPLDQYLGDS